MLNRWEPTKQRITLIYCIGIFAASWSLLLAGILSVDGHLEDAAITPWLIVAMITPAVGVLLPMGFSKAARENVCGRQIGVRSRLHPYCILVPTLVAFAAIAIFSWMGWGDLHGSRFQPLAVRCRADVGYWAGENKTGSCSLATSF